MTLHDDVPICPALTKLDRIATDAHWHRLTLPHCLEEDSGAEVVFHRAKLGLMPR
jgi:hypothetical protein